jgi:hypothetical protein
VPGVAARAAYAKQPLQDKLDRAQVLDPRA